MSCFRYFSSPSRSDIKKIKNAVNTVVFDYQELGLTMKEMIELYTKYQEVKSKSVDACVSIKEFIDFVNPLFFISIDE